MSDAYVPYRKLMNLFKSGSFKVEKREESRLKEVMTIASKSSRLVGLDSTSPFAKSIARILSRTRRISPTNVFDIVKENKDTFDKEGNLSYYEGMLTGLINEKYGQEK